MRILVLSTDYPSFLTQLYARNRGLADASFAEQTRVREDALFAVETFYAAQFARLGHVSGVRHANNFHMQAAWAREHGIAVPVVAPARGEDSALVTWLKRRLRPYKALLGPIALKMSGVSPLSDFERHVLLAQIEDFKPDVILNQAMQTIDGSLIGAMRRPGRFIMGHIGVDPPPGLNTQVYDLGISQIPWVVEHFRSKGLRAEQQPLCFEPSILERLGPAPQKDIDVSFVGGLSAAHGDRVKFLEDIAREFRLSLWVPSLAGIAASSPLHACRQGEVYGRDMFEVLRRSKITLNSHINVARGSATNMRLFEATGVGTFLLTDNLSDLPNLFVPGRDVATYDDTADCLGKIRHYLADDAARETIARAGQAQTLTHHTYAQRAAQLVGYVEKYAS